jgi:hypothetical protein
MTSLSAGSRLLNEEANAQVAKQMIACWQIQQAMKKNQEANGRAHGDRTQVDRLLNPRDHNVTLATLEKAAVIVGRQLRLELL